MSTTVIERDPTTGGLDSTCTHDAVTAGKILSDAVAKETRPRQEVRDEM